jgi:hypothetical protein
MATEMTSELRKIEVVRTPEQLREVAAGVDEAEVREIADRLEHDGEVTVHRSYDVTFRLPRRGEEGTNG